MELNVGVLKGGEMESDDVAFHIGGSHRFLPFSQLAEGFNGIPVALLAVNNPIAVVFSGIFMAMLDIVGQNLTGFTAYNEYITDVIIAVIVYLSAFSLVIRMWFAGKKKKAPAPKKEEKGGEAA